MKGYPKYLNCKEDYYYVKANFPKTKWGPSWQALLDSSYNWFVTGELPNRDAGIEDATHRVIEQREQKGDEETVRYFQQEWQEDANCKMFRIGFTRAEVEAGLADNLLAK